MSALQKHLVLLGSGHYSDAAIEHASNALLGRLDLMQEVTIAAQRVRFGDVVDGAIAPDGRFYGVERPSTVSEVRLCGWDNTPLAPCDPTSIADADHISLCGFPDGKTLAYLTFDRTAQTARLHMGDWSSEPLHGPVSDRFFWEVYVHGKCHYFAAVVMDRESQDSGIHVFEVGQGEVFNNHPWDTRGLQNLRDSNWVSFVEYDGNGRERARVQSVQFDKVSREGPWVTLGSIVPESIGMDHTGKVLFVTRKEKHLFTQWVGEQQQRIDGYPYFSEGERFDLPYLDPTSGGVRVIHVATGAVHTSGSEWQYGIAGARGVGGSMRGICFVPDNGHTAVLNEPISPRGVLDVTLLDKTGQRNATEQIVGGTGKMRRLGTQIAVEGKDEHGPTVSLFHTGSDEGRTTYPLVGRFDRLAPLSDGSVGGWHYSNGVLSVQRYPG